MIRRGQNCWPAVFDCSRSVLSDPPLTEPLARRVRLYRRWSILCRRSPRAHHLRGRPADGYLPHRTRWSQISNIDRVHTWYERAAPRLPYQPGRRRRRTPRPPGSPVSAAVCLQVLKVSHPVVRPRHADTHRWTIMK